MLIHGKAKQVYIDGEKLLEPKFGPADAIIEGTQLHLSVPREIDGEVRITHATYVSNNIDVHWAEEPDKESRVEWLLHIAEAVAEAGKLVNQIPSGKRVFFHNAGNMDGGTTTCPRSVDLNAGGPKFKEEK